MFVYKPHSVAERYPCELRKVAGRLMLLSTLPHFERMAHRLEKREKISRHMAGLISSQRRTAFMFSYCWN